MRIFISMHHWIHVNEKHFSLVLCSAQFLCLFQFSANYFCVNPPHQAMYYSVWKVSLSSQLVLGGFTWSSVLEKHLCDGSTFDIHSAEEFLWDIGKSLFCAHLVTWQDTMKPHYTPTHPPTPGFCFCHALLSSRLMTDRSHQKWGFEGFKKHTSVLPPSLRLSASSSAARVLSCPTDVCVIRFHPLALFPALIFTSDSALALLWLSVVIQTKTLFPIPGSFKQPLAKQRAAVRVKEPDDWNSSRTPRLLTHADTMISILMNERVVVL